MSQGPYAARWLITQWFSACCFHVNDVYVNSVLSVTSEKGGHSTILVTKVNKTFPVSSKHSTPWPGPVCFKMLLYCDWLCHEIFKFYFSNILTKICPSQGFSDRCRYDACLLRQMPLGLHCSAKKKKPNLTNHGLKVVGLALSKGGFATPAPLQGPSGCLTLHHDHRQMS